MIRVLRWSNRAITGSKAGVGSWDWDWPLGGKQKTQPNGSHLILVICPVLATRDPHAFLICFSELCICSSSSQPL